MSAAALLMVVGAGALHASWNALTKRSDDPLGFLWALLLATVTLIAPVAAILAARGGLERSALPYIVASGCTHIGYYLLLGRAYQTADLSLAYPIARGTGVLLIPVGSALLFSEAPTAVAWGGIALIAAGILLLHLGPIRRALDRGGWREVLVWPALGTGIIIAIYSLIDARGVRHANPIVYVYATQVVALIGLTPALVALRKWPAMRRALDRPLPAAFGGVGSLATYAIVLAATKIAPVAYVGPAREVSIVFGVLIGIRYLGEIATRARVAGALVVLLGIVTIKLAG